MIRCRLSNEIRLCNLGRQHKSFLAFMHRSPSSLALTFQTPSYTCRGPSSLENPQCAAFAEYPPPRLLQPSQPHHLTGSETALSGPASLPSRTPSPLPFRPTDSSAPIRWCLLRGRNGVGDNVAQDAAPGTNQIELILIAKDLEAFAAGDTIHGVETRRTGCNR